MSKTGANYCAQGNIKGELIEFFGWKAFFFKKTVKNDVSEKESKGKQDTIPSDTKSFRKLYQPWIYIPNNTYYAHLSVFKKLLNLQNFILKIYSN